MIETHTVDTRRRRILRLATTTVGALGVALGSVPFLRSLAPSERARARGAPLRVDIGKIEPGKLMTVAWRGRPVWIMRRTPEMLATLPQLREDLRDPDSEQLQQPGYIRGPARSIKPEIGVMLGVCTHLGCVPKLRADAGDADLGGKSWLGGFFCPCHGSKFDFAGRVYKAVPAPLNLVVPPHRYESETTLVIGEDATNSA